MVCKLDAASGNDFYCARDHWEQPTHGLLGFLQRFVDRVFMNDVIHHFFAAAIWIHLERRHIVLDAPAAADPALGMASHARSRIEYGTKSIAFATKWVVNCPLVHKQRFAVCNFASGRDAISRDGVVDASANNSCDDNAGPLASSVSEHEVKHFASPWLIE